MIAPACTQCQLSAARYVCELCAERMQRELDAACARVAELDERHDSAVSSLRLCTCVCGHVADARAVLRARARANETDPLHPTGRCAGEGQCDWCVRRGD